MHSRINKKTTSEKRGVTQMRKTRYRGWVRFIHWSLLGVLFFLAAGTMAACGSASKKSADDAQIIEEKKSGAIETIGETSKNALSAAGKVVANSEATGTILTAWGLPPIDPDSDPLSDLETQLGDAIALLLGEGTRTGDTITFDPDEEALCADQLLSLIQGFLSDPELCTDFYKHVTSVLTPGSSSDEGTIAIKYDNRTIATIGYSPGSLSIQFDLAELKSIVSLLVTQGLIDDPGPLPETFEGAVRTTFTEIGPDHERLTLSIEKEIQIKDAATQTSITIAAASQVFELTANGQAGTASLEVGLGAIDATFPLEDSSGVSYPTELKLKALTVNAELDPTRLVLTDVSLGNEPLTLTSSPDLDISLGLATFGLTLNGEDNSVTFNQDYKRDYVAKDVLGLFDGMIGEVHVSIPANTKWTVLGSSEGSTLPDFGSPLNRIDSGGPVTVTGTGDFSSSSETFTEFECFNLHFNLGAPMTPDEDCSP